MSSSTAAKTFRNDSRATSMPRSFWSFWNVFITSNFPFVAAKEGRQRARHFVDVYGEARSFLEPLSCARKEVWRRRAGWGVRDEGGNRTKEGRGLPLLRVWRRNRDRSGPTRSDGLGDRTPIIGHSIRSLTWGTGGVMKINQDCLSGNPMFNNKVTKGGSNLFQGDYPGFYPIHLGGDEGLIRPNLLNLIFYELHLRSRPNVQQRVRTVKLSLEKVTMSVLAK